MGSAATREAHMMKYGATAATESEPSRPASRAHQSASIARLSQPKRRDASPTAAESSPPTSNFMAGRSPTGVRRMRDLFPLHEKATPVPEGALDEDGLPIADATGYVPPRPPYPIDWRRLPESPEGKDLVWLYASVSMERLQTADDAFAQASRIIERQFAAHGIPQADDLTSRREVRSMIRSTKRFALLVDIIATKRRLYSGEPHAAAMRLYSFVEKRYPVHCVFMAVGITDNRAKRVMRDVFNTDPVAGSTRSTTKKLPFTSLDGEHMMLVHPSGEGGEDVVRRGQEMLRAKEEAQMLRHFTPKYVPPPTPAFVLNAQRRRSSRPTSPGAWSSAGAAPRPSTAAASSGLPECDRCWRHGTSRPESRNAPLELALAPTTAECNAPVVDLRPTLGDTEVPIALGRSSKGLSVMVEGPTRDDISPLAQMRLRRTSARNGQHPQRSRASSVKSASVHSGDADEGAEPSDDTAESRLQSRYATLHAVIQRVAHRNSLSSASANRAGPPLY
jgi:hypothetical protein